MTQTEWKEYLVQQAKLHPSMEPQDVYKMMYQAVFGAEHLLQDEDAARAYFQKEFEEVIPVAELLYEQIQENVYRVNLRAWKKRKLPLEWLFKMFVGSVKKQAECDSSNAQNAKTERIQSHELREQKFIQYVESAAEVVKDGAFAFSYEDFQQYTEEYMKQGIRPVHHSERYREAEKPAYRLVSGEYLRILPILEAMAEQKSKTTGPDEPKRPFVIAIDGRCASGKSTMAQMLSEITGAGVIHMDDFFLPMELRTEERLAQPGGNVHYERFEEEVIPFLKEAGAFTYRRFDCRKMQLGEECLVADSIFRVIEGAYSHHPVFGEYADLTVFSDVDSEAQLERISKRDGEAVLAMFQERWIPMEEKYFLAYQIKDKVDFIL